MMKRITWFASIALLATALYTTSCNNNKTPDEASATDTAAAPTPTPIISYALVREYPHDNTAFTEGLQYVDGYLYESTGQYGRSDIRKTDLATGKVLEQHKLDPKYFGEGLTVLNGKIYQLTWQEKTCLVYDQKTLKQIATYPLTTGEGWGMTTDGTHLIYSDGTSTIHFADPNGFKEVNKITVTDAYGTVSNINELEYIKGYLYANQWQTEYILKIDPATGKIAGQANLGDLRARTNIPQPSGNEGAPEVLNGIAYDAAGNRIFITGKNWPKLFEIKLDN